MSVLNRVLTLKSLLGEAGEGQLFPSVNIFRSRATDSGIHSLCGELCPSET